MAEPGKIYTRNGDRGVSAALDGRRRPKSDSLFRSLGALEELSASLGSAAADPAMPADMRGDLHRIQRCIFVAGTAIAGADARAPSDHLRTETAWLESRIDTVQAGLPPLTHFILPGGSAAGAALHWSRTICRRAETEAVAHFLLEAQEAAAGGMPPGSPDEAAATPGWSGSESPACLPGRVALLTWLNRLSDALFVFARHSGIGAGVTETVWSPEAPGKEGTEG